MAVKYLETNSGFLAIGNKMVMQLTDISLKYQTATDEVTTFDANFVKQFTPTMTSWTADANGIVNDVATGYASYTGGTAALTLTGSTNGLLLLESIKNRAAVTLVYKIDSGNVQRGSVIITSCDMKAQVGKSMTFSVALQGSGSLTKSST